MLAQVFDGQSPISKMSLKANTDRGEPGSVGMDNPLFRVMEAYFIMKWDNGKAELSVYLKTYLYNNMKVLPTDS